MLSAKYVNGKDLRTQCGVMNDTGILKSKIQTVGVKKEDMLKVFLKAVNDVPQGSEDEKKIPDSVFNFYNLVVEGKDEDYAKREAEKKPKKERGPNNEQIAYDMIVAGKTRDDLVAEYTTRYTAKGKGDDAEFIQKRTDIYANIAKRRLKAEGKGDQIPAWLQDKPKEDKPKEKPAEEKPAEEAAPETAAEAAE